MVVRFGKKIRKQRGKRWHGYGAKKKHRGKGSSGGRGWAGSHKHKWSYVNKYEPDHFGKRGFNSLKKKGNQINIDQLVKLAGDNKKIDLKEYGYAKLLGRGDISKAISVRVDSCSSSAKEKIESVGGSVEISESTD